VNYDQTVLRNLSAGTRKLLGVVVAFGLFATSLIAGAMSTANAYVVEASNDDVQGKADPDDFCRDALGAEQVPLREALLIRDACDGASNGSSFFVVSIDDEYVSRPLDELVTVNVVELVAAVAITPTPSSTPVPTATATPTSTRIPAASAAPALALIAAAAAAPAVAPTTSTVVTAVVSAQSATDFGWAPLASSPLPSSPLHAATVEGSGGKVVSVGFTG